MAAISMRVESAKRLTMVDQDTAVLIGDMNLLRCFCHSGIPTFVVSRKPRDVLRFSKYYQDGCLVTDPASDPDRFVSDLLEVGQRFSKRPTLYFCDDSVLLTVSRRRRVLEPLFRFALPPPQIVEDLVNKSGFARLAQHRGLPVPKTLVSTRIATTEDIVHEIPLPCIFKPDSRHYGWYDLPLIHQEGRAPQKVLRANTPEEVGQLLASMRRDVDRFVVQPFIPGGARSIYSVHAYYTRQSEPLVSFVGRKIRTFPKESGTSTCLELVHEPSLAAMAKDVLTGLQFVGPAKLDFIRDARDGRFYLLEVNARYTLWNYLGAVSGINIPIAAWADLHGEPYSGHTHYRTDVKWVALRADIQAFLRDYHRDHELTWWQWLRSLQGPKVYHLFAWNDPLPFLRNVLIEGRREPTVPSAEQQRRVGVQEPSGQPRGMP